MPDPKKKIMVKVLKKSTAKAAEPEAGLTSRKIKEIDDVTAFNKKRIAIEGKATGDSISGANKAKLMGKDIIDQRRAGNQEANKTRVSEGNPQVFRGRTMTGDSSYTDKYAPDGSKSSVDTYSRLKPLEKDMPVIKKTKK